MCFVFTGKARVIFILLLFILLSTVSHVHPHIVLLTMAVGMVRQSRCASTGIAKHHQRLVWKPS